MNKSEQIKRELLASPSKLLNKKPFTRGAERITSSIQPYVNIGNTIQAPLPRYRLKTVTQEQFMNELDPNCHDVLFDDNIPSLCVKLKDNNYHEIVFTRMAVPIQRVLKNKQTMHLAANPMQFTLIDEEPNEDMQRNFIIFKQYWDLRNQDGMKYKMVDTQKSYGDAGLLYYFDYKGQIKSRILSYSDGYVLCPHNDHNGDRILETVYYCKTVKNEEGEDEEIEFIDTYDDSKMYRYTRKINSTDSDEWNVTVEEHGFSEIPLITKRGDVAWNNVQPIIESYEVLYNVFNAIQKRFGWGIFYVKGKFKEQTRKIAGSVVLNDTSIDGNGDAKFLTPPTPQGTIDTLNLMMESIQLGSSTTFILPKDIKMSGDVSGIAVQLTQSQDIELALQNVIEWQNVADKMVRLFKEGLAKELVRNDIHPKAVTEFKDMDINAKFKVWRPLNEYEYNQMITMLTGAGILSKESGIELNTVSKPDEKNRVRKEAEEAERKALEAMQQKATNEEGSESQTNKSVKEESK